MMNDNTPRVTTTVLTIQQHIPDRSSQQQQRRHQQGAAVNGGRRNVYRTNSRRRCDLTPAVKRCVVTDKSAGVSGPGATVADDSDTAGPQQSQQPTTTLFQRRYVIKLDPLTPRPAVDQSRPGRGNMLATTGTGKARWQRQQTTYQLTPRALRTARTDVSARTDVTATTDVTVGTDVSATTDVTATTDVSATTDVTARTDVSAGPRLTTRREQTMPDDNLLSATGKKLLDGSATARNGETCRVIELNLNTQTPALHGSETGRRHQLQRTAATAVSLHCSDSTDHGPAGTDHGSAGTDHGSVGTAGGVVLPQLATHR